MEMLEHRGLPHLALIDIKLPGMDGIELAYKIHEFIDLPIIMLTTVAGKETVIDALNKVAEDYIIKPFDPEVMVARVQRVLSSRRGQILGYDAKEGWDGWDEVRAHIPQAEMHDLIVELRSLSLGLASYTCTFDHLQELSGRLADQVIERRKSPTPAN